MKVSVSKYYKNGKDRKVSVRIDPHDVWNMDSTLAYIIHPMLIELKPNKQGAPVVDDEDVPMELQSWTSPAKDEYDVDGHHFSRWDYILDEMLSSTINVVEN